MIIDIHTHLFSKDIPYAGWWEIVARWSATQSGKTIEEVMEKISGLWDVSGDLLVKDMDEGGIDKAVLNVLDHPQFSGTGESLSLDEKHRIYAEAVKRHPDRLIGCIAGVDPNRPTAVEFLERAVKEWGMIGLKLHPCFGRFYANDRRCYLLYEKCVELGIPAYIHTGIEHTPFPIKYGDPIHVDDVALDFPELKIVMFHAGLHHWWPAASAIAGLRHNVFLELGFWQLKLLRNPVEAFYKPLRAMLDEVGPSKIMYGTDWPALRLIRRLSPKVFLKAFREPPEEVRAAGIEFTEQEINGIFGDNAAKLLGLSE